MRQIITADQYDAWYSTQRGRWIGDVEFALLRDQLRSKPGASVIDIGCGTGWFSRRFAAAGFNVTGMDIDSTSIAFARKMSNEAMPFVVGDARRLPFPDQSFDHAMSVTALCFVNDWPLALREIVRVSRGRWVVGLLNRHSVLWWQKGRRAGGSYAGAYWHTASEIRDVLRSIGAQQVCVRTAVFSPSGTRIARMTETVLPNRLRWGSFLLASGSAT